MEKYITYKKLKKWQIAAPTLKDVKALIDMYNQSWLDTYENIEVGVTKEYLEGVARARCFGDGKKRQLDAIKDSGKNPDRYIRIAKDTTGRVIGMIDGRRDKGAYELERLYVDKDWHGTGLAHDLWQNLLE